MLNRPSRLEITPLPDNRCPSIRTPAKKPAIRVVEDRALDASILMLGPHKPYDPANPGFVRPTSRPTTTTSTGKPPALLKPSYPARRRRMVIRLAPPCLVGLVKRPVTSENVSIPGPQNCSPQRSVDPAEPPPKPPQVAKDTESAAWLTYDDAPLLTEYPEQFEAVSGDLFAPQKHPQTALERVLAALTPLNSIRRRQGTRRATFTAYDTALRLFKVTQYRNRTEPRIKPLGKTAHDLIKIFGVDLDAKQLYKAKDVKTIRQCVNNVLRAFWPLETRKRLVLSDRAGKPANSITIQQNEIEMIKKICKLLQKGRNFDKKDPDNCIENIRSWIDAVLKNDRRPLLTEEQKKSQE
ncbi:hypothetical protein KQX54_013688 [Cotesia glomerata]|uniref:Core-binding (CB) domain-containing protein n=1 Tax=Cotesia glomerata TaxID=32391 RepID=A0AAV7IBT8_COTGL|nr:hypothetical protein KQX54_013688 [Cotesia glomerata]